MKHSVSKTLLGLAIFGAFASNNANASDCGSTTASSGALTVGQTECISGNGLYYYIDVEGDNTALEIQTSGGTGEADILVNTASWATDSSYTQRTNNSGTEETLAVTANAGRLYVSVFGIHQGVTLDVIGTTDTGGGDTTPTPTMCGTNTLSGYELTLNSQECISGNGQYYYIDVEADNTPLIIETKNGSGQADVYVNTGNWATRSDNIASAVSEGTDETLKITANAGRLYISIFGLNDEVSFKVSADDGTPPIVTNPNIPTLPSNPGLCGTETPEEGRLTFNQVECVNSSSYTIYVPADDIDITVSTGGGTGEFDLLVSQQGWATSNSYDHKSSNVGTSESITFTAKEGWLYLALDADTQTSSEVSLLVAIDPADLPSTNPGTCGTIDEDAFPTDATRFTGLNGSDLVTRIALSHPQNISPIYNISGADATQIYSEANMIAIANAINARAPGYSGDDRLDCKFDADTTSGLESLFYFLRGSFYVSFAHPDDVPVYSDAVKANIKTALRTFFNNSSSWIASEANGSVLKEALITVDSAGLGADFNDVTIRVLTDYNIDWQNSFNMNAAANSVFTTLFRAQWDEAMKAVFIADDSILDALNNFQNTHRDLIGTDAEYVLLNAVNEMSRLYHIDALFPRVKVLVKRVLNSTSKTDNTKALWIKAASMSDYYDRADCGYYDICGFAYTLEAETLAFNYKCSDTLKIRAQQMYNDQAAWICQVLGNQETNFHSILGSGYQPVADDNNAALQLVIFNSPEEYKTYAGQFFNMDTNNGGMYLEGSPINAKNQARFIAYEADWMQPNFHVWNLQHEYVHYLDGRFDLYGDFQLGMTVDSVWWSEGLGEYISYGDGYERAITVGKAQDVALSEVFKNNYNSGQTRVYQWGYLAVRFMFENHKNDVNQILNLTRTGQYPEYQTFMNNIGTSYDVEFNNWLVNGVVLGDSNIVEIGPNDTDSASSGTAGNWAGEPVTISTDFSPCIVDIPANAHDKDNNNLVANQIVECVNSSSGGASFIIRNEGALATRFELRTTGGWGNADIMFKAGGWPTAQDNNGYANGDGNWDSLVIELNPDAYWHYITLDGEFGGVKVTINKL
ncbi:collagenase [Colwellia sp. 75C3]|uniref:collagenase n=1 Tax=Colwellia sp. 75C3 TaxID=888425 RepID=UPI0018E357B5|nr:collagenase [Colwellia sp. 75C3]